MGPAVPLVGAIAGAGVSSAIGGGILGSIAGFVVSTAISQIGGRLFAKKPKAPAFSQEATGRAIVIRSSIESHKVVYGTARVSGPMALATTTAANNEVLHLLIPLAGHEVEEIGTVYLNELPVEFDSSGNVTTPPYAKLDPVFDPYVLVQKFTGSPDQQVSPAMLAEVPGWTTDHRLRGIAYLYVRLRWNQDIFPTGIPNISAVVKGKKVFDPRTALTSWTDNAALCIRDYLTSDYGFSCDSDEINETYFIAAANVSDESVTKADASTQARYACNGIIDTSVAPIENLQSLVTSTAGIVTYVQGQFRLQAAAYESPVGTITPDMLAGQVKTVASTPRKELFNAVRGTYVDPNRNWQPTDFPFVTNSFYVQKDNGEQIFKDIELPFENDPERAQRIGKVILEKARQGIIVEMPLMHHAMKYAVGDVVTFENEALGWEPKEFRIMKWSMPDAPAGVIQVTMQEESSASYDWNSGEASTIDAAPDTNLPNPFFPASPGVPLITEEIYVTRDGAGVKAKAIVSWGASNSSFVSQYQVEYRLTTATDFTIAGRTEATTLDIQDIAPGTYLFRVKAVTQLGVSSAYTDEVTKEIVGLSGPPADITGLSLSSIGGLVILRWNQSPDIDVRFGGNIAIRHSPDTGAGWASSTSITGTVTGGESFALVPNKPGRYLLKAVDSSGIESVNAVGVNSDQATVLQFAPVDELVEHPTFLGTKIQCYVTDDGMLANEGLDFFDNIESLDDISDVDSWGGVAYSGQYEFATIMDLGSVKRVRLTTHILANIVNVNDRIDERAEMIDSWASFDGDNAAEGDVRITVLTRNDDPSTPGVWQSHGWIDQGEYQARAFRFIVTIDSYDLAYNVFISELSVKAEEIT